MSIETIALEYLSDSSDDENKWFSGIENLWLFLGENWAPKNVSISKWNDSWLITTLQSILIRLRDVLSNSGLDKDTQHKYENVQAALETILLNYTNYHTLIKRGCDLEQIYEKVLKKLSLSESEMESHIKTLKANKKSVFVEKLISSIHDSMNGIWIDKPSIEKIDALLKDLEKSDKKSIPICELIKTIENQFSDFSIVAEQFYDEFYKNDTFSKIEKLETWVKRIKKKEYSLIFSTDLGIDPWDKIRRKILTYHNAQNSSICVEDCLLANEDAKDGIRDLRPTPTNCTPKEYISLYSTSGEKNKYDARNVESIIQCMQSNYASVHLFIRFSSNCNDPKTEINELRKIVINELSSAFAKQYKKEFGIDLL